MYISQIYIWQLFWIRSDSTRYFAIFLHMAIVTFRKFHDLANFWKRIKNLPNRKICEIKLFAKSKKFAKSGQPRLPCIATLNKFKLTNFNLLVSSRCSIINEWIFELPISVKTLGVCAPGYNRDCPSWLYRSTLVDYHHQYKLVVHPSHLDMSCHYCVQRRSLFVDCHF